MSYILDALKRADAERGRGTVPGLHAQPTPGVSPQRPGAGTRQRGWPLLAIILALGGVAAGVWLWRSLAGADRTPVVVSAAAIAQRPAEPVPVPEPVAAPAPQVIVPATPAPVPTPIPAPVPPADPGLTPIPQTIPSGTGLLIPGPAVNLPPLAPQAPQAPIELAPPPVKAPAVSAPAPAPTPAQAPAPKSQAAAPSGSTTGMASNMAAPAEPVARPAATAVATQSSPTTVPLLSELPEDIRRPIPTLTITGAVDSKNPAQRLLLVNGQVLPQGAAAAPEVMIEEIRARSSIFTFHGTRFRVAY